MKKDELIIFQKDLVIISIEGVMTNKNIEDLEIKIDKDILSGKKGIIIDCSKLTFASPTIFKSLVVINNKVKKNHGILIFARFDEELFKNIKTYDYSNSFSMAKTLDKAIDQIMGSRKIKDEEERIKYLNMEIAVSGNMENLAKIRKFITDVTVNLRLSEDETNLFVLAVDEAAANIMKYAYKGSNVKHMVIQAKYEYPKFTILIADNGEEFDPTEKNLPVGLDEYIRGGHSGGLGIFIIEQIVDKVNHYYIPSLGNRLIMEKIIQ
ncbi:ATP-binding protein [Candidatus Dependentiae bacterium]|nr:ATP-binding protein [Candidatus Dependentiae bacterium]